MILWIPLEFDNWLLRYLKTHEDFDIGFSQEFVSGMRGDFLEASTRRSQARKKPLGFSCHFRGRSRLHPRFPWSNGCGILLGEHEGSGGGGVVRKSERYELVYNSHIAYMIYIYIMYIYICLRLIEGEDSWPLI